MSNRVARLELECMYQQFRHIFLVVEHFPLFLGVPFPLSTLFKFLQKFVTHQHGINFAEKKLQREILISDPKSGSVSEEFSIYEFPVKTKIFSKTLSTLFAMKSSGAVDTIKLVHKMSDRSTTKECFGLAR